MVQYLLKYRNKLNDRIEQYCQQLPLKTRRNYIIIGFIIYVLLTFVVLIKFK
ncbi:hypothetical protein [Capnocytophaga canimorsus]|uniref:hypothetical protein n=1 Tax=Capnocytophaga canimorsus TaxID=28188 RepID=UPI001BB388A2|nr:hypothetical protein [Capnocytophaga canimorsus]